MDTNIQDIVERLKANIQSKQPPPQTIQEWHAAGGSVPTQYRDKPHEWHAKVKHYATGGAVDNTTPDMKDGGNVIDGPAFKRGGQVKMAKGGKVEQDTISATKPKYPSLEAISRGLANVQGAMASPFGYANPPGAMLGEFLGIPAMSKTAERLAYGEPLTSGRGQTLQMLPETTEVITGALPMVGPAGRATKATAKFVAPKAGSMLEDYAAKTGLTLPMDVWHGSPHAFEKFSPTKIGTGEGSQAYGHGLYFAESPDVAKSYQPRSPKHEEKLLKEYNAAESKQNYPKMEVLEDAMTHKTPDEIMAKYLNTEDGYTPEHAKAAKDYAKWFEKNKPEVGGLYKVDLPDEQIAKMLDWDKELSEQSKPIQEALLKFDPEMYHPQANDYDPSELGMQTYNRIAGTLGVRNPNPMSGDVQASEFLKSQGIPGIKYKDLGSRGLSEGTSNFVVFPGNEGMLSILERNGQPLMPTPIENKGIK
jgi:hypothetical protein